MDLCSFLYINIVWRQTNLQSYKYVFLVLMTDDVRILHALEP